VSSPTGVATGAPDLWCTYAAVRTLSWLGALGGVVDPAGTARYLASRRNGDGGYAWSRGMASDAWATFYCTQGLRDLQRAGAAGDTEAPDPRRVAGWLQTTWSGSAYGMTPGQAPEAWATFFATRTAADICRTTVPDQAALLRWLASLQAAGGGLSWSPEHARAGIADVRACFYGVMAWRAVAGTAPAAPPWDVERLTGWLRAQQGTEGGFRFSPEAEVPCLWATYRSTVALDALGAAPRDTGACARWITERRGPTGAFVRWDGYRVEDVWASFCAIGALRAIGAGTGEVAAPVVARMRRLRCPQGGFTYREPELAADALVTAAEVIRAGDGNRRHEWRAWLEGCQLPNEGGIMYMPARGSEIRCTLWALEAGAFAGDQAARRRIARWLTGLQNPDGGFGYWEGRGSDIVSTNSAVEIGRLLGVPLREVVDRDRLLGFLGSCRVAGGEPARYGNAPGAAPTLRATLQALRARHALGAPGRQAVLAALAEHRVRSGGYANEGRRIPDLLSSYEAAVTARRHGVELDPGPLRTFVDRVHTPEGTAWTPLAPHAGDPLAGCLGALLDRHLADPARRLPALTLS